LNQPQDSDFASEGGTGSLAGGSEPVTQETEEDLAKTIGRYACDPVAARQLQRLNAFSLPTDSTAMFQGLLQKLEQTERAPLRGSS
jgi:hypothetical protein